jgi:hypothetical protein
MTHRMVRLASSAKTGRFTSTTKLSPSSPCRRWLHAAHNRPLCIPHLVAVRLEECPDKSGTYALILLAAQVGSSSSRGTPMAAFGRHSRACRLTACHGMWQMSRCPGNFGAASLYFLAHAVNTSPDGALCRTCPRVMLSTRMRA